ncbi:MAG: hypothetical protein HY560_07510 [Gemmatimonadetes bacterium]|nr:hypothetical protein [Gemmatimonadota bacterium]
MNALTNPRAAQIANELESDVGVLVPAVDHLLSRVTDSESSVVEFDRSSIRLHAAVTFPDEIGHGAVVAHLFRYRDDIRLDIEIEHNRMFARPDGSASDRACYLNDFVASVTLKPGIREFPEEFVRHVVAGVAAARDAVRRHNRRNRAPWNEIQVSSKNE